MAMILNGTLVLSEPGIPRRTAGHFAPWMAANALVLRRYFGVDLFAGSLNVLVPKPSSLQSDLDDGKWAPSIVIRHRELEKMRHGLGDARAWACQLAGDKFPHAIDCWILRRMHSTVDAGIIEIVAREPLRVPCKLRHDDDVVIAAF